MYEIIDEVSLRYAIKDYLRFYSEERPQDRYWMWMMPAFPFEVQAFFYAHHFSLYLLIRLFSGIITESRTLGLL